MNRQDVVGKNMLGMESGLQRMGKEVRMTARFYLVEEGLDSFTEGTHAANGNAISRN